MTWFKVDDSFHSHPKAAAASLAAIGLWTVAGAWCGDHLTDGNVPHHVILSLSRGAVGLADELVTCGLWRRTKSGYRFHQWDERNPNRSTVEEQRLKRASAGRLGGLASGRSRKGNGGKSNEANNERTMPVDNSQEPPEHAPKGHFTSGDSRSKREANASALASPTVEPPTRPGPPPSKGRGAGGAAAPFAPDGAQPPPPNEPASLRCRTCGNTMSSAYHRNSCLKTIGIGGAS